MFGPFLYLVFFAIQPFGHCQSATPATSIQLTFPQAFPYAMAGVNVSVLVMITNDSQIQIVSNYTRSNMKTDLIRPSCTNLTLFRTLANALINFNGTTANDLAGSLLNQISQTNWTVIAIINDGSSAGINATVNTDDNVCFTTIDPYSVLAFKAMIITPEQSTTTSKPSSVSGTVICHVLIAGIMSFLFT